MPQGPSRQRIPHRHPVEMVQGQARLVWATGNSNKRTERILGDTATLADEYGKIDPFDGKQVVA